MNAEEKLRVARLVTRLARQPEVPQDEDAALELAALLKVRPDAPYLLMQRTLMLELALERAQAELEQLRQAQAQSQTQAEPRNPYQANAGYEPSLPAPSASRAPLRPAGAPSGGWQPGVNTGPAMGNNPGYGPTYGPGVAAGAAPSAAGGFLRNAAAVGAGVLGGSLLFHGLDSLFHDHGGGGHQSSGLLDQGGGSGLLSGDMQAPLDAISGNEFLDPANDPLSGGADPFSGDMLGDGGEFDNGGDDWA